MVTVSDHQSWLARPCRIVLESNHLLKIGRSADHTFNCGSHSFSVIDEADASTINLALEKIRIGQSAAIIPHQLIRPDALFFDMDATVIEEESLVEIAKASGKQKEIEAMTKAAMAGGMDFKESLRARLALLKGVDRSQVLNVRPTISRGMTHLASWCHQQRIPMFLVSGGFVDLAGPVAQQLGFKDFRANRFAWNGDKLAGDVDGEIVDAAGKRDAVSQWCKIHQLNPKSCIAVGDGANDQLMMSFCGMAAGFSPKKVLWEHLQLANHTGDHRFLVDALVPLKDLKI